MRLWITLSRRQNRVGLLNDTGLHQPRKGRRTKSLVDNNNGRHWINLENLYQYFLMWNQLLAAEWIQYIELTISFQLKTVIVLFLFYSDHYCTIYISPFLLGKTMFIIKIFDNSFVAQYQTITIYYLYNGLKNNWSLKVSILQFASINQLIEEETTVWLRSVLSLGRFLSKKQNRASTECFLKFFSLS